MLKKTLPALLLCAAMILSLAGCGGKDSSNDINIDDIVISGPDAAGAANGNASLTYATYGSTEYSSALYLLFMQDAFREIQDAYELDYTMVLDAGVKLDDGSIQTGRERISSYADEEFRWLYVIDSLYRESGLSMEDSVFYNQAMFYAGQTYKAAPDYYKFFGIGMADLLQYYIYSYEYNDLFYHMYGEGGEKEIPVSELESIMSEKACRLQYIYLPYYDAQTGEAFSSEEIAQRRNMAQDFLDRYNSGESFEDLVYENYLFLDPSTTRSEDTDYNFYVALEGGSFSPELLDAAVSTPEGKAKLVETGEYAAVVLHLPVNAEHGASWRSAALQLAYSTGHGSDFDLYMIDKFQNTEINYAAGAKELLSPDNYVLLLERYYSQANAS